MSTLAPIDVPRTLLRRTDAPLNPSGHDRWWRWAAIVSVVAAVTMHAITSITATAPRTPWDEVGVLQMGRIILGEHVASMSSSGYYPGWSFFIAPIWLITHDPATVYRLANILANLIALSAIVPLAMIARRLGLTTAKAVTVAAITMLLPSRVGLADYVLSEQLLSTLVVWATLAAFAVWRRPTVLNGILFSLAVAGAYFTHARALVLVLAAGVWLLFFLRRRVVVAIVALATLGAGYAVAQWISRLINDQIIISGFSQDTGFLKSLAGTSPANLARIALNQTWVQLVGTSGLVAIGAVVIVVWMLRDLRRLRLGPAGFIGGTALAAVAVSVIVWSGSAALERQPYRFDAWVYSRYIDPFVVVVVLVALVVIVRGVSLPVIAAAAGASLVVILPVVLWVAPGVPTWGSTDGPANSAAVLQWRWLWPNEPFERPLVPSLTNANSFWLLASLWVLVALGIIALLRRRPRIFAVLALAVSVVLAAGANPSQFRDYPADITASIEQVEDGGPLQSVDFYLNCRDETLSIHQARNWMGFWLAPREVTVIRGDEPFTSDLVVACGDWPEAGEYGAVAFDGGTDYTFRLWVLPGALQDELRSRGLLVPPGIQPPVTNP